MREVVICEPVRTPIGRYGGALQPLSAAELGEIALRGLLDRTGLDPDAVDDVVLGHCYPNSEAPAIGRVVALNAGLPVTVPGMQVDRRCGSGLQSVLQAGLQVSAGVHELVVAGGAESMSNVPFYSTEMRWGVKGPGVTLHDGLARGRVTAGGRDYPVPGGMLETAENLRREYGISRAEQDQLALISHQRAVAAQRSGVFAEEIIPVTIRTRKGEEVVDTDEHPRADASLETLAGLRPVLGRQDPEATVTAGNASGQNDAAAMCIVTHPERADALGLRPLVRLVSWAVAGVPPKTMGIGPVPASRAALERAGLKLSDMDLIELNEAFAAQVLACTREWGFGAADFERLNVHGSGISLGHPVGATGTRILTTLAREMRRRQVRYGLETMCIGGGQGLAAIFETAAGERDGRSVRLNPERAPRSGPAHLGADGVGVGAEGGHRPGDGGPVAGQRRRQQRRDGPDRGVHLPPPSPRRQLGVFGQVPHAVQAGVADPGVVGAALDLGQVALRAPAAEGLVEFGPVPDPVAVVRVPRPGLAGPYRWGQATPAISPDPVFGEPGPGPSQG